MKKRLTALLLTLTLLAACGTAPPPATTEVPSTVPPVATPAPTTTPTPSPTATTEPTPTPVPQGFVGIMETGARYDSGTVNINGLYSWNPTGYTYHQIEGNVSRELQDQLLAYKPVKDAKQEEKPVDLLGFLLTYTDDSKENYYVTETQLYSKERGVLDATPEQCKVLHDFAVTNNKEGRANAQWLRYMNMDRIIEASYDGNVPQISSAGRYLDTTEHISFTTTEMEYMKNLAHMLRTLVVKPGRVSDPSTDVVPAESIHINFVFDIGIFYSIDIFDGKLLIASSDMQNNLIYQIADNSEVTRIQKEAIAIFSVVDDCTDTPTPDGTAPDNPNPDQGNPMTGKPIIYLYPEKATDVTVKLDFNGELWYTYPTIKDGGWSVTAHPDGRLVNKADSTEHYYLFWDGSSDTDWKFDSGFCIAGNDTEAFLREKLAYMGLTPREYNDFITYWVPKLKSNPYNLITFATEQYEQLAPLTVSPAPDSVLRVHMVYKPLTARQAIPEQQLTEGFERNGFTMVEWGGSISPN